MAVIQAESTFTVQKETSTSDYRQSLETVSHEAGHISTMIDQFLSLAQAVAAKEQLSFDKLNLGEFLRNLSSDVEILCQDKGLEFHLGHMDNLMTKGTKQGYKDCSSTF